MTAAAGAASGGVRSNSGVAEPGKNIERLGQAGIPAHLLLSKADLLAPADLARVKSYVEGEMARRLGISALGIGFPGRYLVKCVAGGRDMLVDCFDGRPIDREGCQLLLDQMYGGKVRLSDEMLRASPPRETLARMLNNLRTIFTQKKQYDRALRFVNLTITLQPDLVDLYRDRGVLRLQQEDFGGALEDLELYLRRTPGAQDAPIIREHVQLARKLLVRLN